VNKLQHGTSVTHGLQGQVSNHADVDMQQHLQQFFDEMSTKSNATIVRQHVVGAKDDQEDDGSNSDADDQVIQSGGTASVLHQMRCAQAVLVGAAWLENQVGFCWQSAICNTS